MGLLDRFASKGEAPFSEAEGFAAILISIVAADGDISDEELEEFTARTSRMKLFRNISDREFSDMLDKLCRSFRQSNAVVLSAKGAKALSAELRPTAFAVAVDMIFADGHIENEERLLLDHLQRELGIEEGLAATIVDVIAIKNQG